MLLSNAGIGPRRGGQGAGGRPASRRRRLAGAPGPLRLAGQLERDGTPRWELDGGGGPGGAAGVAGKEGFVIVFVSESKGGESSQASNIFPSKNGY